MGMLMSFMGKGLPSSQMFNMLMSTLYKQFAEKEIKNFEDFHQAFLDIFNTVNSALPGKHYDVPSRKDVEEFYNKWGGYPDERRKIYVPNVEECYKKWEGPAPAYEECYKKWEGPAPAYECYENSGANVPEECHNNLGANVPEECYNKWGGYPEEKRKTEFVEFMKKTMKLSSLDDITIKTGIITPPAAMAIKKAGQNVPQMKMIKAIPDVIFVPSITLIALISAKLSRKIIQRKSSPHSPSPPPLQPPAQMKAAAPPAPASCAPSPQPGIKEAVAEEHPSRYPPSLYQPGIKEAVAEEHPSRYPTSLYQPSDPKESSKMTWYSPSIYSK